MVFGFAYTLPFLHYHPLSRQLVIANHAFIDVETEEQIFSRSCVFEESLCRMPLILQLKK